MNLSQMRKNVGQQLYLRPIAQRIEDNGQRLERIDHLWRLDAILEGPQRIRLVNIHTGHVVELQPDNVREYRSPNFLVLRCQLSLTSREVKIEPLVPVMVQPGSEASAAEPKARSVNLPPGFEVRLNRIRFQVLKDSATQTAEGAYAFPVELLGRRDDMRAFLSATGGQSSATPALVEEPGYLVRLRATYSGSLPPSQLETMAYAHGLQIVRCGPTVRM